jgi:signal transduction histidine kinase
LWTVSSSVALAAVLLVRQAEVRGIYQLVQEAFAQRTLQRMEGARDRLQGVLGALPAEPGQLAGLPEAARAVFSHQVADLATYGALLGVWVTDRQGTALFASDPADVAKPEPCVPELARTASFQRFHSCRGEEVLCLALPLVWKDTHVGWLAAHRSTVELRQELALARDEIRRGLLRLLIVFAVVCTALGVTLWYLVGQLSRAEAEASERARLASMGELALAMAHEVRNPLNSISLICQYVLRLLPGDEEPGPSGSLGPRGQGPPMFRGWPSASGASRPKGTESPAAVIAEQVGLVRDEVDKLARVVDNVMRFARPSEPVPEAASVAGICRRAVELQQAELVKNQVEVSLEVPPELTAWVDADQVTRALINLVRNAAEAMPQGGTLQLTAGKEGGWVAIRVRDTGPGVGSQEGFLAPGLRQGRPGPGLGLPIALAIVRAHGGELRAENHRSGGAVFTVLLPADEDSYGRRAGAAGRR